MKALQSVIPQPLQVQTTLPPAAVMAQVWRCMSDVAEFPVPARLTEQPAVNTFRFKLTSTASLSAPLIVGAVTDSECGSTVTLTGTPIWTIPIILMAATAPGCPALSVLLQPWAGWPRFAAALFSVVPVLAGFATAAYFTRQQNDAIAAAAALLRDTVLASHRD